MIVIAIIINISNNNNNNFVYKEALFTRCPPRPLPPTGDLKQTHKTMVKEARCCKPETTPNMSTAATVAL